MAFNIVGAWKLLHCSLVDADGHALVDPLAEATGMLMYDADGHMSVQIMMPGHAEIYSGTLLEASDAEIRKAYESYMAYYGQYVVNESEQIIIHKAIGSTMPNLMGLDMPRRYEIIDKNTMILSNTKPEALVTDIPVIRYLTWVRI